MTSINEEVENILNGKFDHDIGLRYMNDMAYPLKPQQPQQNFGQMPQRGPMPGHLPPHAHQQHPQHPQRPPSHPQHPVPQAPPQQSMQQQHHTPQMQHAHIPQRGQPMHIPHAQAQHEFRGTPQQVPAQLAAHSSHTPPGPRRSPQLAERIHCLLHINNELLRQISAAPIRSSLHTECLKRLEANVSYLHALANDSRCIETSHMMPAIMTHPQEVSSLAEPYRRLQTLA